MEINMYKLYDDLIKNPGYYDNIYEIDISKLDDEYKQKYINILDKFKNLTKLNCSHSNITDDIIEKLITLTDLTCNYCVNLTDNAFVKLVNLINVECTDCDKLTANAFINMHSPNLESYNGSNKPKPEPESVPTRIFYYGNTKIII
jgi:Leucine-rich repeat (LRR) protein